MKNNTAENIIQSFLAEDWKILNDNSDNFFTFYKPPSIIQIPITTKPGYKYNKTFWKALLCYTKWDENKLQVLGLLKK